MKTLLIGVLACALTSCGTVITKKVGDIEIVEVIDGKFNPFFRLCKPKPTLPVSDVK